MPSPYRRGRPGATTPPGTPTAPPALSLSALPAAVEAELLRRAQSKFARYYPDTGPLRRELYWWAVLFFAAGAVHRERVALMGNRVGKTEMGAYETTCHLTGRYPPWWTGKRFAQPVRAWAAGDTMETTRDIIQHALLGPPEHVPDRHWTGMLPAWAVYHTTRRLGAIPNCIGEIHVRHWTDGKEDGTSVLQFKSYDQGRTSFQGAEKHWIWLDEEPPDAGDDQQADIWTECLLRTSTVDGLLIGTFTPLRGMTPFIERYLEDAVMPDLQHPGQEMSAASAFRPDPAALGVDA